MISFRFVMVTIFVGTLSFPFSIIAAKASNTTLLRKQELSGLVGKEGVMLTVSLSPGESSPVHRHNAHTFVYVLDGSIVMQLEGGEPVILERGETFYESPDDIHKVSKNASDSQPATFLVFFVKDKGTPLLLPVR